MHVVFGPSRDEQHSYERSTLLGVLSPNDGLVSSQPSDFRIRTSQRKLSTLTPPSLGTQHCRRENLTASEAVSLADKLCLQAIIARNRS